MSLSHVMIRILGVGTPAHQSYEHRTMRDSTPVRSQQLVLDPGVSSVTRNRHPSLSRTINWNHGAHSQVERHTRRENRLRLILLDQERFELRVESMTRRAILRCTHVLEVCFFEFSLESFIPCRVHGVLLQVVDAIDNLISSDGNRFFSNSFSNGFDSSCYLLTIQTSRESVTADK